MDDAVDKGGEGGGLPGLALGDVSDDPGGKVHLHLVAGLRAKEGAMTHLTPLDLRARGACSREEPQPKFFPATTMSPGSTVLAKSASISSMQWEARAAGEGSFRCRAGMMTSVSTLSPYL